MSMIRVVTFFVLWLLTLHFQRSLKCAAKVSHKKKAYIHIGPHKTGSTHLQHYLSSLAQPLRNPHHYTVLERTYLEFDNGVPAGITPAGPIETQVRLAMQKGNNIIYSAEPLYTLHPAGVLKLKEVFKDYDVTIVLVWREPLNRYLSHYNHRQRRFEQQGAFQSFLSFTLGCGRLAGDIAGLNNFAQYYGKENIRVIDYYGAIAAGIDIAHVFLCEIIGILCEETMKLNHGAATRENSAVDQLTVQIIDEVIFYGQNAQNCQLHANESDIPMLLEHMEQSLGVFGEMPPVIHVPLHYLANQAKAIDRKMRELFGQNFMHANITAGDEAREQIRYGEIDEQLMLTDKKWITWLKEEVRYLSSRDWLRNCGNPAASDVRI